MDSGIFGEELKRVSYAKALEMGPTAFVKDYLFPAMRREQGKSFAMSQWTLPLVHKDMELPIFVDGIKREAPACRTVSCIGGTMELITGEPSGRRLGALLGLTEDQAQGLFYFWGPNTTKHFAWPLDLAKAYRAARTPAGKEKIAEKAVLRAIQTKGRCLERRVAA